MARRQPPDHVHPGYEEHMRLSEALLRRLRQMRSIMEKMGWHRQVENR